MKRDEYGIIVQPEGYRDDKTGIVYDDGGDSSFSTGLMAGTGSEQDFQLMPLFIKDCQLVRHPFQSLNTGKAPHNDPKATSRDQVKAFFFGLHGRANEPTHVEVKKACLSYANGWKVNTDILSPADRVYLFMCAGETAPLWLRILAAPLKTADLLFNCYGNPSHEMNQATATNIVFGKEYIAFLFKNHPDLFKNLDEYFCGWRGRCEISTMLKAKVRSIVGG